MNRFLASLVGGALGVALHRGLFIHGEWHVRAPAVLLHHLGYFLVLAMAVNRASFIIMGYLLGLFSSIIIYRIFLHRLRSFPGPRLARITKIWHAWHCRYSQNYLLLSKLHDEYGDFVRTGPSEITVYHPGVFMAIDGPQGNCVKSEWYDILHPKQSLVTARVKEVHGARRREWNRGFTPQALDQYQERILPLLDQLEAYIDADIMANRVSEVTDLLYWLGFDRMGDFIFSRTFNMLSRQEWHHIVVLLQRALSLLGPLSPLPWLIHIAFKLFPRVWILRDWFRMVRWCEAQMLDRLISPKNTSIVPDVAHYLLRDARNDFRQFPWLTGDSILAIVAGSEPTVAVLIGLFSELAKHTHHADIIRDEINKVDIEDSRELAKKCPHLEGAIFEALRLYPALPTGGNREKNFEQAAAFIPERWYQRPEMVRSKVAFTPFGTGHTSCLGRALAMNDMRLITARLVQKYNFSLPPGETGDSVLRGLKDQFTSNPGRLRLVFQSREK
ncbi:hypothetical protein N7462_010871 [Penicillium macrosclerotiorum]|uniref:uncharacterized protein n=1 Tax=Penicillium macrosclerotiorum TaxID=303699 RepID=UPI002548004C|nr:uncharacterized protein N7462_010871 [Penicillium macrosclerotiorum]KAJ5669801.1 hypothetical protein N7462_010871 [Penicillium macrosclerotiorum]